MNIPVMKINHKEAEDLLQRVNAVLSKEDAGFIEGMIKTILFITQALEQKNFQLKKLLKRIFGFKTEKSHKLFNSDAPDKSDNDQEHIDDKTESLADKTDKTDKTDQKNTPADQQNQEPTPQTSSKGHGRNGSDKYTGADIISVQNTDYKNGDPCPECLKGKLYKQKDPGVFVFITGNPPVNAIIYKTEKLRCNLCGVIFEAKLPDNLPSDVNPYVRNDYKHYDETAKTILIMLKYGCGFPFNRIAKLQESAGIPLPVATQWDNIESAANSIRPVYEELKRQAAQGTILHNDDTTNKILTVMKEINEEKQTGIEGRTGIFTTGIISIIGDYMAGLFFTGRQHAGENTRDIFELRQKCKSPPILMSDAKSGNVPDNMDVITCNCNVHARRYFVDIIDYFPNECQYVITDVFGKLYKNEAITKERAMSPDERLEFHRENSGPIMNAYHSWLKEQIDKKLVEPNSVIGKAISYNLNHWEELTRFLHVPGAPIDNNICERALKPVICHRKNSLFYKNGLGAYIGDMFMSLIHTCNLNKVNTFNYLTQLQIHSSEVLKNPSRWLPWNYHEAVSEQKLCKP